MTAGIYTRRNIIAKNCRSCGGGFYAKSGATLYCNICMPKVATDKDKAWRKKNRADVKDAVLAHYGGKCACCGETQKEFLGIDHKDGGGSKHRKATSYARSHICRWLVSKGFPSNFQVLCHNCNLAKGFYGACPHSL